jgi:hypothetical protein
MVLQKYQDGTLAKHHQGEYTAVAHLWGTLATPSFKAILTLLRTPKQSRAN